MDEVNSGKSACLFIESYNESNSCTNSTCNLANGKTNYDIVNEVNCKQKEADMVEEAAIGSMSEQTSTLESRRHIILALICLLTIGVFLHMLSLSAITGVVMRYFDVSEQWISYSVTVYFLCYVLLFYPICFFVNRFGQRVLITTFAFIYFIGCLIKCASIYLQIYWLIFLGQTFIALCAVVVIISITQMPAIWFPDGEIHQATSLLTAANFVGGTMSFFLPPLVIENSSDRETNFQQLIMFHLSATVYAFVILIGILVFFREKPKTPPSQAQAEANVNQINIWMSTKKLLTDRNFIYLMICVGSVMGIFNAILTVINQLIRKEFPDSRYAISIAGNLLFVSGAVGALVFGYVLKLYPHYKRVYRISTLFTLVLYIPFAISFELANLYAIYACCFLFGLFCSANWFLAGIFASQIGFPNPEYLTMGLVSLANQTFGAIIGVVVSNLSESKITHGFFATVLLLSVIVGHFIEDIRRRDEIRQLKS